MKIDIITLFPNIFAPLEESMIKKAQAKNLVSINVHDLRRWSKDDHKTVDDKPYGGGAGMVLMIEPIYQALNDLRSDGSKVILLCPQGEVYDQKMAESLSAEKHLILIAGRYEGFDERIREHLVDSQISIGNYVLTGGELPAMVVVDSIVRLIPGVLGDEQSLVGETHSERGLIKHPVYTRPEDFNGWRVPEVLLSGNHAQIAKWKSTNRKRVD